MGLLSLGTAFDWPEASVHSNHVRQLGIRQLIHLFHAHQKRADHGQLLWGDEIEYLLVSIDAESKQAKLSLSQLQTLNALRITTTHIQPLPTSVQVAPTFHQEYGRFMLESTPGEPYGPSLHDCLSVESNMRFRRFLARNSLPPHHIPLTLTAFPRLGAPGVFTEPYHPPCGPVAQSLYLPDQIINEHVRFPTLTANIRQRRGSKVEIYVPIYHDINTPRPFRDPTVPTITHVVSENLQHPSPHKVTTPDVPNEMIYLDAMGFGMGCSCLQLTFQAPSLSAARRLYDALVPIAPIMLALSAASPVFKGFLCDRDTRWSVISAAVDDRNLAERSEMGRMAIPKSRYASVSVYISDEPAHKSIYDDIPAPVDATLEAELLSAGFDRLLARHFAHLFIRDPLVIFSESLTDVSLGSTDHFENIQSTNWQSVRFKPPPAPNSSIGWRVEFRTMEVQLTDFENAAYAIFVRLLSLAILSSDEVNFYIPLSKVDSNMRRAEERDSCRTQRFWFIPTEQAGIQELSMSQIICGTDESFTGLLGLVRNYLSRKQLDLELRHRLDKYLDFIHGRASGRLLTTATYLRKFIDSHPGYEHNSVVSAEVTYDLIMHAKALEEGLIQAVELLGEGYAPLKVV